jgi:hypothetical protein
MRGLFPSAVSESLFHSRADLTPIRTPNSPCAGTGVATNEATRAPELNARILPTRVPGSHVEVDDDLPHESTTGRGTHQGSASTAADVVDAGQPPSI